jgi:hypothetical protein
LSMRFDFHLNYVFGLVSVSFAPAGAAARLTERDAGARGGDRCEVRTGGLARPAKVPPPHVHFITIIVPSTWSTVKRFIRFKWH